MHCKTKSAVSILLLVLVYNENCIAHKHHHTRPLSDERGNRRPPAGSSSAEGYGRKHNNGESIANLVKNFPGRNYCDRIWNIIDSGKVFDKLFQVKSNGDIEFTGEAVYRPDSELYKKTVFLRYLQANEVSEHFELNELVAMAKAWIKTAEEIVSNEHEVARLIGSKCKDPFKILVHKAIGWVEADLKVLEKAKSQGPYVKSRYSGEENESKETDFEETGYTVHYFDYRGRGEEIRLILHYAGMKFKDVRYTKAEWDKIKPTVNNAQLPFLDLHYNGSNKVGCRLFQSYAIERYLAKRFGLAGKGVWEQAKVDEFADLHKDNENRLFALGYQKRLHHNDQKMADISEFLRQKFPVFVKQLKSSKSGFLVHSGVTWVDFVLVNFLETFKNYQPALWKFVESEWPILSDYHEKVHSLPKLKKYVNGRKFTME